MIVQYMITMHRRRGSGRQFQKGTRAGLLQCVVTATVQIRILCLKLVCEV